MFMWEFETVRGPNTGPKIPQIYGNSHESAPRCSPKCPRLHAGFVWRAEGFLWSVESLRGGVPEARLGNLGEP